MSWNCTQCGAFNTADVVQCRCGALNYGGGDEEEPTSKRPKVEEAGAPPAFDPFPTALVGKMIAVYGLAKKPELNGAQALVKDFDYGSLRYTVEVDGGRGTFKLKRENLRDLATPAPPQTSDSPDDPFIGKMWEVQGLNAKPELNGTKGVVKEFDVATGRYTVELEGGVGSFKLKPDNLRQPQENLLAGLGIKPIAGVQYVKIEGTRPYDPFADAQKGGGTGTAAGQSGYVQVPGMPAGSVLKTITCTSNEKGAIIGAGGKQINKIRQDTGAHCTIESRGDTETSVLTIKGSIMQVEMADKMVQECLALSGKPPWEQNKPTTFGKKFVEVPKEYIGSVVGKGGCCLKEMQTQSQAKITFQLATEHDPSAPPDKQTCVIQGTGEQMALAEQLVLAKVAEVSKGHNSFGTKAQSWEAPKKEVCPFFVKGFCGYGDKCRQSHDPAALPPKEVCPFFQKGFCGYGDQCIKSHVEPASAPPKEVCPFFQKGFCGFGDQCNKSHSEPVSTPQEVWSHSAEDTGWNSQNDGGGSSWSSPNNASGSSWSATGGGQSQEAAAPRVVPIPTHAPGASPAWNSPPPAWNAQSTWSAPTPSSWQGSGGDTWSPQASWNY